MQINIRKTKIKRLGDKKISENIKIGIYEFEDLDKFKYLVGIIDSAGKKKPEIQSKIHTTNRTFHCT